MPTEFAGYGAKWRLLHPGWTVIDWHDLGSVRLRNAALWEQAPIGDRHRWRADIARLEILYQMGGVYVDCDIEPLRAIDGLLTGLTCALATSANTGPNGSPVVSNAVIAAEQGHPFLRDAIRLLPVSAEQLAGKPTARVVGPWHLQRVLDGGHYPSVTIWPSSHFYPQSNADRDGGKTPDLSASYGWHRWATSRDRR